MISKQNIPNYLTYARVLAVPVALVLIVMNKSWTAAPIFILFVLASITDLLDGYLARKWDATSRFGALLDPIADKLLVGLMLLYIVTHNVKYSREITMNINAGPLSVPSNVTLEDTLYGYSLFVPAALILLREIYIAGLREFLAQRNVTLPVSKGGKWKTALQMVAVSVLLFAFAWPDQQVWRIGEGLLWLAAALAVVSAAEYSRTAWPHLKG